MKAVIGKTPGDPGAFPFGPVMPAVFFGVGLHFRIRLGGVSVKDTRDFFAEYARNGA